ncbi:uncharacterized protein HKW66_Vig0037060 [Vigna angularis]|uniref:Uncharacterized protein n=1 Tax=Phaseolus angularis TaxID=3914 RepID=A0A8T0LA77_PHAAN|nr:uncharacterized protein HKW66_Vig0037060 [Vigna angularis]
MAENLAKMLTVILVVTAVAMEAQPVDSAFAIPIYHCTLPECIAGSTVSESDAKIIRDLTSNSKGMLLRCQNCERNGA